MNTGHSSPTLNMQTDRRRGWLSSSFRAHLMTDVNPDLSTIPLIVYCFMTGFVDAVAFSALFVWPGFQTGNSVQLSLALARLFQQDAGSDKLDTSFHLADQQALTSVTTFLGGAFLGRIGDRMGAKTRGWLCLGTFIQAVFMMAAAIAIWKSDELAVANSRGDPAWHDALSFVALGFLSASLGLQGIMGKRLNTQFATTIVLTTVWCELVADPKLFKVGRVKSRDHKIYGIFALFLGGFISRAILQTIGSSGALGVGTGIRLLCAASWLFVPAKAAPNVAQQAIEQVNKTVPTGKEGV